MLIIFTMQVKRIQSVPLVIGQFLEMIDPTTGIVGSTTGMQFDVHVLHLYAPHSLHNSFKINITKRFQLLCAYFEYH